VSSAASAGMEDLVLAVVARHRRGVAGEGGLELVAAAAGVVDAEDEGQEAPAGLGQGGADRLGLAGWVAVGGVTNRYPSGRDPGLRRDDGAEVDDRSRSLCVHRFWRGEWSQVSMSGGASWDARAW
jgi:hypothetical protein